MPPRILTDRPLTDAEKQARKRAANKLYLRSLEQAVLDADRHWAALPPEWSGTHADTVDRARKAQGKAD